MVFTQKVLRTEVLRTEGFTHNIFYIQTLLRTDRHKLQTETCAHSTRLHSQLLHREAALPLLDHLLSGHGVFFVLKTMIWNILDMSCLAYHKHFETAPGIEMTAKGGPLWNIY